MAHRPPAAALHSGRAGRRAQGVTVNALLVPMTVYVLLDIQLM